MVQVNQIRLRINKPFNGNECQKLNPGNMYNFPEIFTRDKVCLELDKLFKLFGKLSHLVSTFCDRARDEMCLV